jgi:hypothetical protein
MSAAGFKRPGVSCQSCGEPFSLFLSVDEVVPVENLPDPFLAKCPLCDHQATYPKSAIGTLVAVGTR